MSIPAPLSLPSHGTLRAEDFSELQRRLRAGLAEHRHGQEVSPLPASALDPTASVRVQRLEAETATCGGRDLLGLLDQGPAASAEITGDLSIPGNLSVAGGAKIAGTASAPRIQVAHAETLENGLSTVIEGPEAEHRNITGWWRPVRGLSVALSLPKGGTLLLTTLFNTDSAELVARHSVKVPLGRTVPVAVALLAPSDIANAEALSNWYVGFSGKLRAIWSQGVLLMGGTLLEAVSLPPGDYTVVTELLVWPQMYVPPATLTVTQL